MKVVRYSCITMACGQRHSLLMCVHANWLHTSHHLTCRYLTSRVQVEALMTVNVISQFMLMAQARQCWHSFAVSLLRAAHICQECKHEAQLQAHQMQTLLPRTRFVSAMLETVCCGGVPSQTSSVLWPNTCLQEVHDGDLGVGAWRRGHLRRHLPLHRNCRRISGRLHVL